MVFSVVPAVVPKLALQGAQLRATPDARSFSKEGNQIVDSYSRQAATSFRAIAVAGPLPSKPASHQPENRHRPHVAFLALDEAQHGHSTDEGVSEGGQSALTGVWAPTTKPKPALLRNNSRILSSPRTHSPGWWVSTFLSHPHVADWTH